MFSTAAPRASSPPGLQSAALTAPLDPGDPGRTGDRITLPVPAPKAQPARQQAREHEREYRRPHTYDAPAEEQRGDRQWRKAERAADQHCPHQEACVGGADEDAVESEHNGTCRL